MEGLIDANISVMSASIHKARDSIAAWIQSNMLSQEDEFHLF